MTRRCWGVVGLLLVVALLAGCAPETAYRGAATDASYITDVPPSFYGNDPALRHWFTAPYWMPDASP
jgi:hypothetical protein